MKFKATLLSLIFIFATVFGGARSFMGKNKECCKISHCDTKSKKDNDSCNNFCCINFIADHSPACFFSKEEKVLVSKNKINPTNDKEINNNGLPFFHPPSQV